MQSTQPDVPEMALSEIDPLLASFLSGGLSRRAFVQRLLALGVGMDFIETLLGPGTRGALAASHPQRVPSHAPYVVMVVLDAFRADYQDLAPMPNLEWLMSRGVTFPNAWVGQLESYTPTGHATLSTGATPAHQGIIGFSWLDSRTGQVEQTCWYEDVMAGRLEQQLVQHGVNSIPSALKRQDPHARVVALSSEKYYAADAMGGHAADVIFYGQPIAHKHIVSRGIPHHLPPEKFMKQKGLSKPLPLRFGQYDELSMTMAIESLHAFDPRLLMINLPGADVYGHRVGGPGSPEVMKKIVIAADQQLGRLITALLRRGVLDETIFVVTADHGMVKNTYQIENAILQEAVRKVGGDLGHFVGGNSGYIWLRNRERAGQIAQKLVDLFPSLPLYGSTDAASIPFGYYLTLKSGAYQYNPVPPTGTKIDPALDAAYRHLLRTFAGPIAPDVVLAFQENMISTRNSSIHGEHGGATWGAQHIPLVISGPGVRNGKVSDFPARLMDVAPTVLALLGLPPTRMDGVVLADALRRPARYQERRQDTVAQTLLGFQKAIVARSLADLRSQSGIHGPVPRSP